MDEKHKGDRHAARLLSQLKLKESYRIAAFRVKCPQPGVQTETPSQN